MNRLWIYVWCLIILFPFSIQCAAAADSGAITGVVRDSDGKALGGARVTLNGGRNSTARDMSTGATGQFHFEGLSAGDYVLAAEVPGLTSRASSVVHLETSTSTASVELILVRTQAVAHSTAGAAVMDSVPAHN